MVTSHTNKITGNFEREILKEILSLPFQAKVYKSAKNFRKAVVNPTKRFIDFWGGDVLLQKALKSMVTGRVKEIERYFDSVTGSQGAWEQMFMRPGFQL